MYRHSGAGLARVSTTNYSNTSASAAESTRAAKPSIASLLVSRALIVRHQIGRRIRGFDDAQDHLRPECETPGPPTAFSIGGGAMRDTNHECEVDPQIPPTEAAALKREIERLHRARTSMMSVLSSYQLEGGIA